MSHENLKAIIEDLCIGEVFTDSELDAIVIGVMRDDGRLTAITAERDALRSDLAAAKKALELACAELASIQGSYVKENADYFTQKAKEAV